MAPAATPMVRLAPPDHTLPKPWRGIIDGATGNLYFWNPETKLTTYVRPTADPQPPPQPDIDNRSGDCDDINSGDRSHQSQGATSDTSSQITVQQSVPASEENGENYRHKHETTVVSQGAIDVGDIGDDINNGDQNHQAKRNKISGYRTLKRTVRKKQKTTPPLAAVDDAEGQVEESTIKPKMKGKEKMNEAEVSHSVEEGQQESKDGIDDEESGGREYLDVGHDDNEDAVEGENDEDDEDTILIGSRATTNQVNEVEQVTDEVLKLDQLAKETPNMTVVEGEVPQLASTTGALPGSSVYRSETVEMNAISPMTKETSMPLSEEVPPIEGTHPNQELLSIVNGSKGLDEEMIDGDGFTNQDGGPIIDNKSNGNTDCLMTEAARIEAKLEKQPINPSSVPTIDKVEEDLALSEAAIDRLAGVVESMHNVIRYTMSASETVVQLRRENEELKKKVADLEAAAEVDRAKLKETCG